MINQRIIKEAWRGAPRRRAIAALCAVAFFALFVLVGSIEYQSLIAQ